MPEKSAKRLFRTDFIFNFKNMAQYPLLDKYESIKYRFEIYTSEDIAGEIIAIAKSFNIDARIIGRVKKSTAKKLTIESGKGTFEYR